MPTSKDGAAARYPGSPQDKGNQSSRVRKGQRWPLGSRVCFTLSKASLSIPQHIDLAGSWVGTLKCHFCKPGRVLQIRLHFSTYLRWTGGGNERRRRETLKIQTNTPPQKSATVWASGRRLKSRPCRAEHTSQYLRRPRVRRPQDDVVQAGVLLLKAKGSRR